MPKGQYVRVNKPKQYLSTVADASRLDALEARIADLELRLVQANEYFAKGYIPPNV